MDTLLAGLAVLQEYLESVLEHFRGLQDGSKQRAVINVDDEAAAQVLEAASGVPCITFGMNNASANVRVESLELSLWQTTVSLRGLAENHLPSPTNPVHILGGGVTHGHVGHNTSGIAHQGRAGSTRQGKPLKGIPQAVEAATEVGLGIYQSKSPGCWGQLATATSTTAR